MSYSTIKIDRQDRVGVIQIDRPKALNALNSTVMDEISQALIDFDAEPEVGAIVITGNERAFAAGADVKEMSEASAIEMYLTEFSARWDTIRAVKKPVIAAVSGWCLGGGNELAMACDMVIASETAKFGQPEINVGIIPGAGGTQRLTKAVGKAIAMEVILNNRNLSAEEALAFGLINRVVPVELYLEEAIKFANEIAHRGPLGVRMAKEMINQALESSLSDGIEDERRSFYILFGSEDQKEGMKAFIEKRKPEWKGK